MIFHSQPTIEKDDVEEVRKLLKSGMIAEGQKVKALENNLCNYIGSFKARATCTGRSALVLGLWTLGIGKGDEVILPTYVCHSVMDAVIFVGAEPVIVDIGDDYCIDPEEVKRHITSKTKAIIVVHIFGISAKIRELKKIAEENSLYLIEDCAQAIGGEVDGKKLGSFGDISFFSFQATKMVALGEGGALVVNNKKIVKNFEDTIKNKSPFIRMGDLQAVLGLNQLKKLEKFIGIRKTLAEHYINLLEGKSFISIPIKDIQQSVFFRFPVRIKKKFDFYKLRYLMEKEGVHIRKGVDRMLHRILKSFNCPKAEKIFEETVSLPIYPKLREVDIQKIVQKFLEVLTYAF